MMPLPFAFSEFGQLLGIEFFWPVVVGLAWGAASWSRRLSVSYLGSAVVVMALLAILLELALGEKSGLSKNLTEDSLIPADWCWCGTVALVGLWATFRCASPGGRSLSLLFLAGGFVCAAVGTLLEGKFAESGAIALAGTISLIIAVRNTPVFFPVVTNSLPERDEAPPIHQKQPPVLVRFRMTISALVAAMMLLSGMMFSMDGRIVWNLPTTERGCLGIDDEWPASLLMMMIGLGILWKASRTSTAKRQTKELSC